MDDSREIILITNGSSLDKEEGVWPFLKIRNQWIKQFIYRQPKRNNTCFL